VYTPGFRLDIILKLDARKDEINTGCLKSFIAFYTAGGEVLKHTHFHKSKDHTKIKAWS